MTYKICSICVTDSSVESLSLDNDNVCQYCKIHNEMEMEYPLDKNSFATLLKLSEKIKKEGLGQKYDCIVGVSGGKDSSYLLYLVKEKLNLNLKCKFSSLKYFAYIFC